VIKRRTAYIIRPISPDDFVSGLYLGKKKFAPLEEFLKKDAKRYHKHNAAKTYVIVSNGDPKAVVGYVSVLCGHIQLEKPPSGLSGYNPHEFEDFPAVKIARLAVDKRHGGHDLGTQLVNLVVGIANENIMPHIGCRFVVLDSKKDSIKFYLKQGFTLLKTRRNMRSKYPVMFTDIGRIR